MPHREQYRLNLPHFQQPGQAYFITWCLKDAVPAHALKKYTSELQLLKSQISKYRGQADSDPLANNASRASDRNPKLPNEKHPVTEDSDRSISTAYQKELKQKYYSLRKKYIKAFNELLDNQKRSSIDLSKPTNTDIIAKAFQFWENKKLKNYAYCIMPNHVHWVLELFWNDTNSEPVYLEDILYSVKRFSAGQINKLENRKGTLWQKESFETTIRNEKHLYYTIEYTLNNPVNAGLVKNRNDWPGSFPGQMDSDPLANISLKASDQNPKHL